MNWPELLIGAVIGALAESIIEIIIPGPSVIVSALKRLMHPEDKRYLAQESGDAHEVGKKPESDSREGSES